MKLDEIINILSSNELFSGLSIDRIRYLFSLCNYSLTTFEKNSMIINASEPCEHIGFILEGKINSMKTDPDGSNTVVRTMRVGNFFGEALVFSSNQFCPSDIITAEKTIILFISSESILTLCEIDKVFLKNFLKGLSDKVLLLNEKIKVLSYSSIRQRLSHYFIEQSEIQQSNNLVLSITREDLSQLLSVTRPSISRELSKMSSDFLISVNGKNISILNIDKMKNLL